MSVKRYFIQTKAEYDFIIGQLDKQGYEWGSGQDLPSSFSNTDFKYPFELTTYPNSRVYAGAPGDVIKVSDLMKPNKDVIYMTPAEKAEFDELKDDYATLGGVLQSGNNGIWNGALHNRIFRNNQDYQERNRAQLEFARAWADPSLIVVKDNEPRFAYKLKPKFQSMLYATSTYLSINGIRTSTAEFHTAKEWQAVDNEIKQIFDRAAEK